MSFHFLRNGSIPRRLCFFDAFCSGNVEFFFFENFRILSMVDWFLMLGFWSETDRRALFAAIAWMADFCMEICIGFDLRFFWIYFFFILRKRLSYLFFYFIHLHFSLNYWLSKNICKFLMRFYFYKASIMRNRCFDGIWTNEYNNVI